MREPFGLRSRVHQSAHRLMCHGLGAQPVTRKQCHTAAVTSRPVPSISRSMGTTTRVADVQKTVAWLNHHLQRVNNLTNPLRPSNRLNLVMSLMRILL